MSLSPLNYRILEISWRRKLSHIGSCLSAVGIIDEIYQQKTHNESFVLSCGHAGLALYACLERYEGKDADFLFQKHGVHPNRDSNDGISCSSGSLGQGITIAVGLALANRKRRVWCLVSDAEANEGAFYEAIRFAYKNRLDNLKIYININGYGAYHVISKEETCDFVLRLNPNVKCRFTDFTIKKDDESIIVPFLQGQDAHYYVMKEPDWMWVKEIFK